MPVGACGPGLVVLLGVARGDGADRGRHAWRARWRGYGSSRTTEGKFDRSLVETGGEALVVSQFTLISAGRARRELAPTSPERPRANSAEPLYERFCESLRGLGVPVATGRFGARMQVELVNDGPVTIVLEVEAKADTRFLSPAVEARDSGALHAHRRCYPLRTAFHCLTKWARGAHFC